MSGNQFGKAFVLTSFGESHGPAIGGVIDGCPAGLTLDINKIQLEVDRRRPGSTALGTERNEADRVDFLSGIFEGKTTGSPIGFIIHNKDHRSDDYDKLKDVFRPSHADFTFQHKYGIRDHRGGGRSSARETAVRVVAGAIARQILNSEGIQVNAYVSSIGEHQVKTPYADLDLSKTFDSPVRCPDSHMESFMINLIEKLRKEGDTVGGVITAVVEGLPIGLGEPVFDKFQAVLAHAMMSINAVKGFEYGSGFEAASMKGSQHNDQMQMDGDKVKFRSNHSGGIQGGISNGQDVYFNLAFKPVASIGKEQDTVDSGGKDVVLEVKGRHDPCVVPRAVPIVEAMACLVAADFLLLSRLNRI